jgi:L-fuculose-phosphate aldolase
MDVIGIVQECRRLAASGLVVGSAGNVSVRDGETVSLTAQGVDLGEVTPDDIAVTDLDGNLLAGTPTSELELHLAIYRNYGAEAIVHTHSPMATAVACVLDELPVIHYHLLALGGLIRVAPFHPFGTRALADAVIDALRGRSAALLANHGAINFAASLPEAVEGAVVLEWACALYLNAARLGTPRVLDDEQQAAVRASAARHGYRSLT